MVLADGTRPDVMEDLLQRGELPGIARTLLEPSGDVTTIPRATTVFPSTTGPAHLPFLTGRFPGPCNVPGIRWFDPQVYAEQPLSLFRFRSYMGLGNFLASRDLASNVQKLFERVPDHASIAGNVRRGVRWSRDLTRWGKLVHNIRSFFVEEWFGMDGLVAQELLGATERSTRFVFASFYAADSNGHKFGPDHANTLEAYRRIDASIGELGDLLRREGRADEAAIALVSDHGLSATHHHLDLHEVVERIAGRCLSHPTTFRGFYGAKSAVMVSGNSMANVYLRGDGRWGGDDLRLDQPGPVMQRLLDALLAEEAVDIVAGRASGADAVIALSRRGRARISRAPDGRVQYQPEEGDPFGFAPELAGVHDDRELLELTWDSDYPDAPTQLLQVFESSRCGHLVVSAAPGHDLRSRYERPAHVGSHGSLHRLHMLTPFLLNRPFERGPRRTVDLHPTLVSMLGLAPEQSDGICLAASPEPA